jgi:hypothetical protein
MHPRRRRLRPADDRAWDHRMKRRLQNPARRRTTRRIAARAAARATDYVPSVPWFPRWLSNRRRFYWIAVGNRVRERRSSCDETSQADQEHGLRAFGTRAVTGPPNEVGQTRRVGSHGRTQSNETLGRLKDAAGAQRCNKANTASGATKTTGMAKVMPHVGRHEGVGG